MNVDRQGIDPRETYERDQFESALSDHEQEDDEELLAKLNEIEEQRKILEAQLRERAKAKLQHAPVKGKTEQPKFFKELKPLPLTGNRVVDSLNKSRLEQQKKQQHELRLKTARVHTFGDDSDEAGGEIEYNIINCNEREKYSGKHLTQRYVSSSKLDEFLHDKKVLRLDKLFAKISPPDFKEPDYFNWCVLGVIVKKSEPMFAANSFGGKSGNKYLKVTISDYNLSLDLTLFGEAFQKYWKLKVGDLIAVLNPEVFVIRNHKKFSTSVNAFSLTLKYNFNSILEIGKAGFNYCCSRLRQGTTCNNIIGPSEKYCHYHQEQALKKTTAKRMEFNGSFKMYEPVNENGVKQQLIMSNSSKGAAGLGQAYNDPLAEKQDRYTKLSKKFSTTAAAKAFFNDESSDAKGAYKKRLLEGDHKKHSTEKKQRVSGKDFDYNKEPEMTKMEKQRMLRQKLKASIIRSEFKSNNDRNDNENNNKNQDDDHEGLDIIF